MVRVKLNTISINLTQKKNTISINKRKSKIRHALEITLTRNLKNLNKQKN